VLFVGRLRSRKAAAVLLEAAAMVRRTNGTARFVLVGDGEQARALGRQARSLGLLDDGAVAFAGTVARTEVPAWLGRADVFCLPSIYEGFPLAILEAMAMRLPVVATRVSGNPEAVRDGETGLLVDAEDAAALAAALTRLLSDPDLRRRMGEAGRRRVTEEFGIERVAGAYLDAWQELLDRDGRGAPSRTIRST
jgi:glycosyltransferase involved in cell wall biosynthesis